jgi:hypothetical protein
MDTERMARIARNEALFRAINERIEGLNESFGELTGRMVVVCECGEPMCIEQLDLSRDEYERVRSSPTQFTVKPGHVAEDVEHVVARAGDHWIVAKDAGEPEEIAEQLDSRERSR